MKTQNTQQEIMLVLNTTFSQREWCPVNSSNSKPLSQEERLIEACWNGMLPELLPEIMNQSSNGKKLFLWHIRQSKSLFMELGESPVSIERHSSIDPHYFIQNDLMN
ncbi:hypothetical protein OCK74_22785 [Chitinophagaceae bacterium LB-8]|uniref:Uncharacterized protein n=1 Tax=Paraflavisolibacter caeni TaxID=2982496 RepID=A0A9X3BH59_9BACT|nr:hypothetical protein [Paraflavisolibacter caeni]MCU7551964.1 hypothetical protein [Paraflavisolibacter caeni]